VSGFSRREVIGGAAAFATLYTVGASTEAGGGAEVVPPTGSGDGDTETEDGTDTDMALHSDPEFVVADTNSDLDDFAPEGSVAFALVFDEQLTYRVEA
jgi:hypothetical protein